MKIKEIILAFILFLNLPVLGLASETNFLPVIPNQKILEDSSISIPFTISRTNIEINITSDQEDLIPNDRFHIQLAQTGLDYTLTLIPIPDAFGGTWISIVASEFQEITAMDAQDITAWDAQNITTATSQEISYTKQFFVQISPVNDAPNFEHTLTDIVIYEDSGVFENSEWITVLNSGPDNEFDQNVNWSITTDRLDLFATEPMITQNGLLRFEPAPNAFGETTLNIKIRDTGGTDNGGKNQVTDEIMVTIQPVNDPPSFSKGENIIVKEDSGQFNQEAWAKNISCGPNETGQFCYFAISMSNPNLFSEIPNIVSNGMLTFATKDNIFGQTSVIVRLQELGSPDSASQSESFTITVEPVNDAPSFEKGPDISIQSSDGPQQFNNWATNIDPGTEEISQQVTFVCELDNPSLFSKLPEIDSHGTLSFTPKTTANGTANVSVWAVDDGGTSFDGIDTSIKQNFTIKISYSPNVSFHKGDDVTVSEDAEEQVIENWATEIHPQPNEYIANIRFSMNTDSDLFSMKPQITPDGHLRFKPAPDAFGLAMIEATLIAEMPDATTLTSISETFTITITAVNDAPSITVAEIASILEDAGEQSITLITSCTPGPSNELNQSCEYIIETDNPNLFAIQPTITNKGILQFQSAENIYGNANLTIYARDSFGETSAAVVRQLTVISVNDPPSFIIGEDLSVTSEAGLQIYTNWIQQISAGPNESDQHVHFVCSVDKPGLFEISPAIDESGTLTFKPKDLANGDALLNITGIDDAGNPNGGNDSSEAYTRTISIHYSPSISFKIGENITIHEDADKQIINNWSTHIYPQLNENITDIRFEVTTESDLFSQKPFLTSDGSLQFEIANDAFGTAFVSAKLIVEMKDGTILTSDIQHFDITITPVNDLPSITLAEIPPLQEDAGEQSIQIITACSPGPPNESEQTCSYRIETDNPDFFSIQPAISPEGLLTFTPAENVYGNTRFHISAVDSEGASSQLISRQVVIIPVNDCPQFVGGDDQNISNVSGMQTVTGWAKEITSGPLEPIQEVMFTVTCDNAGLFSETPQIDSKGILRYTPAIGQYGTSVVHVYLKDNGGIANDGCDMSKLYDFNIRVMPHQSLTINVDGQGQVIVNNMYEVVSQWTQSFALSESVFLETSPINGWTFSHWSGDVSSELSVIDIVMDTTKNITAHFMPISSTVQLIIQGKGWVQLNDSIANLPLEKQIKTGEWVNITALPQERFMSWTGDYQGYTNPVQIQINDNTRIIAQFLDTKKWTLDMWLESDGHDETPKTTIGVSDDADYEYEQVSGQYACAIHSLDLDSFDRYSLNILPLDHSRKEYEWIIVVNPKGTVGEPLVESTVTVRWQPFELCNTGVFVLKSGIEGNEIIIEDMRKSSAFTVSGVNSDQYFLLTWIPYNAFHTFEVVSGWNLVSIPLIPENDTLNTLFPDANVAYGYEGGQYYSAMILESGKGYWVNMLKSATYTIYGDVFEYETQNLDSGWHLVGSNQHKSIPVTEEDVIEVMYQYKNGAYMRSYSIEPGLGYWIRLVESSLLDILPEDAYTD